MIKWKPVPTWALNARAEWREDGQNGDLSGRYFCVFNDGIWYKHEPPRCTPWTVYIGVVKRWLRRFRDAGLP